MEHFDLVVIGSGFYSVGLAAGAKNALVVDEHFLVDPEHHGTFSGFTRTPCEEIDPETEALIGIFKKSLAISESAVDVMAAESCLAEFIKTREVKMLLGAALVGVERKDEEHVVTLATNGGIIKVGAKNVLERPRNLPDRVRALMSGRRDALASINDVGAKISVSDAFFDGEFVLSVEFDEKMENNTLKARAMRVLEKLLRESCVKIIAIAPSGACAEPICDPITDFSAGVIKGKEYRK